MIRDNGQDGIHCFGGSEKVEPDIINNTIAYNGRYGIYFQENYDSDSFIILNNIIAKNDIGLYAQDNKVPKITYNNIWCK